MNKVLPSYTLSKEQLTQRLKLIIDMIKEASDLLVISEKSNEYEETDMMQLFYNLGQVNGSLKEAIEVITNNDYFMSIIKKIASQELYDPISSCNEIEGFAHLCNMEMLKIIKNEIQYFFDMFIELYNKRLKTINKAKLSVLNIVLESTVYNYYVSCHDNGTQECTHKLYDVLTYFDYKNNISPAQEKILFTSDKDMFIIYHFEGQKNAVKEFVDEYCPNIKAKYFNDLDSKIISEKADIVLFLENTDSGYADQLSSEGIPCYANVISEYAISNFSDSIIQFNGTNSLDTIFEYLAAVTK